jgi:hypothetical protein
MSGFFFGGGQGRRGAFLVAFAAALADALADAAGD